MTVEKPIKLIEWVRNINVGDVKYGYFEKSRTVSIRTTVCSYNNAFGCDRGIYVHIHYCWRKQVAVLVAESWNEVMSNKNTSYEYKWREQIDKDYR